MAYHCHQEDDKHPELIDRDILYKPPHTFLYACDIWESEQFWKHWVLGDNGQCAYLDGAESIVDPATRDQWRAAMNQQLNGLQNDRKGGYILNWGTQIQLSTITDTECWVTIFHLNTSLFLELQNPQKYTKPIILFIYAWSDARRYWLLLFFQTNACRMQGYNRESVISLGSWKADMLNGSDAIRDRVPYIHVILCVPSMIRVILYTYFKVPCFLERNKQRLILW